jgi:hypothetical protein
MQRFLLKLLPGLCLVLLAGTALAGGVVVSLVGDVPNPEAGQPFDVRFNIHSAHDGSAQGEFHPTVTAINAGTGEKVTAQAQAAGEVGQYQATLTLPTAGTLNWEILPEAGYPRDLVSQLTPLTVAAPSAAVTTAAPSFAGVPVMLWVVLAALAAVAVVAVITGRRLPTVRA